MGRVVSICALAGAALVASCSAKKPEAPPAAPVTASTVALVLPRVERAAALAAPDQPLPGALAVLDDSGRIWLSPAPTTWRAPLHRVADAQAREVDLDMLGKLAGELGIGARLDGILSPPPAETGGGEPVGDERREEEAPPPPEPEDEDQPEDEGGTGTMTNLEERRVDPSERAEGQYRMKKSVEGEQALPEVPVHTVSMTIPGTDPDADPGARRLTRAHGVVASDGRLVDVERRVLIAASPAARARTLIAALEGTHGCIAVVHGGEVRALRIDFARRQRHPNPVWPDNPWLEVRLTADALAFEAVPESPTPVTWPAGAPLAAAEVARAWTEVRGHRRLSDRPEVDVLVDEDVDVQRLVDLLVALDAAGARVIGLGASPAASGAEAAARGRRIARVRPAFLQLVGDLDRAVVRDVTARGLPAMRACYETAVAAQPDLEGTVKVQFFIGPSGNVGPVTGSGVSPEVSACVAGVIKGLEFPKPGGGGGVQVLYPFELRH